MTPKLVGIVLKVSNPQKLANWYKDVLGMSIKQDGTNSWICEYEKFNQSAQVKLIPGPSGSQYKSERDHVYWKIGLSLQDVNLAREKIMNLGTSQVSPPAQFFDIGYLCHLADPEGFSIELLQHTFEKNFVKSPLDTTGMVLGQTCLIGQITLRCSNIEKSLEFYQEILGMKLLSIQQVEAYGFTLYFLAFTDETPPNEDLNSIEIREWLWQRPYTTIELQHKPGAKLQGMTDNCNNLGVESVEIQALPDTEQKLVTAGYTIISKNETDYQVDDPDGARIKITSI